MSEDVTPIRNASVSECVYKVGSGYTAVCMMSAPFFPTANEAQTAGAACTSIVENNGKYSYSENGETKEITLDGVSKCPYPNGDYWLAAKIACAKEGKKLPDSATLHNLAETIYGQSVTNRFGSENKTTFNADKTEELRAAINAYSFVNNDTTNTSTYFSLWTDSEYKSLSNDAEHWYFYTERTHWYANLRNRSYIQAFCVAK